MKKFLTVLLALSVVFTYSFSAVGSVFATTTTDENVAKALGYVTSIHDTAKTLVSDNGEQDYNGWTVTAENWALAYEDAYEALINAVANANGTTAAAVLNNAMGNTGIFDGSEDDRTIKYKLEGYLEAKTYTADHAAPALKAQLAEEKTTALAKVNAIDTSIYSTKEYTQETAKAGYFWNEYSYEGKSTITKGDACYIAKSVVESVLTAVSDGIEAITKLEETAEAADVVAAYSAMNTWVGKYVQLNGDTNADGVEDADETWTYTLKTVKALTIAEEESGDASDAATIAAKKAEIASNIAAFKATSTYLTASVDKKAAYDEYLDAYNTAETYLVENVSSHTVSVIDASDTTLVANVKTAEGMIEDAADYKAETNKDGSVKYDAEKIDANLKTILIALYGKDIYSIALTTDAEITYVTNAQKADTKAKMAAKVNADDMEYNNTAYYELEWKAVEAAVDAYYAAVDAATVAKDITDAKDVLDKAIAKIDKASKVLAYYAATGKLNATAEAEFTKLKAYAASLAADQGNTDPLVFAITDITSVTMATSGDDGTLVKYYIDNGARTADEIKALNSEVKALLSSAKTVSTLKQDAKDVVAMIDALPAKAAITVSDKDAIEAAYNAYEDLNPAYKVYVSNYSTLKTAIDTVAKAEKDEILKAAKALPAVSKVTVSDKAAVTAVADMIDAYNDTEMYNLASDYTNATVTALVNKIRTIEFDALKAAVKAIPAVDKIAASDKAAIEAVRAAYDAYLADYGDDLNSDEVSTLVGYEKKIIEAEKALAVKLAEEKENIIKATESLKISVSTKLYTKSNKIRVNWKVKDGDASAITGYQVYKSTKAQSGYKFMGKTTKNYMDNKKNLKKGQRYFYKVRAYVDVDGERYYSDWSNKGNRIYK